MTTATQGTDNWVSLRWVLNGGQQGYCPTLDRYEYVHTSSGTQGQAIYTYRHIRTGRYLYADLGGNCYTYNADTERYTPVGRNAAVTVAEGRPIMWSYGKAS